MPPIQSILNPAATDFAVTPTKSSNSRRLPHTFIMPGGHALYKVPFIGVSRLILIGSTLVIGFEQ
jgi:hypothetical protein